MTPPSASKKPASAPQSPATNPSFSEWQKNNLEKEERKKLTQKALRELKERFQAEQVIQERDLQNVEGLVALSEHPTKLTNAKERANFFARTEMRLTVLLVLLIRSNQLSHEKIKEGGVHEVIKDLASKDSTLKVKSGSGERPLNQQEKLILTLATKLPNHALPVVAKEWKGLSKELVYNIKAMDFATGMALDKANGKKPQKPKNLSKEDESIWSAAWKGFRRQHPIVQGLGFIGVGLIGWWAGKKVYNAVAGGRSLPSTSQMQAPIGNKDGIFESTWKWGKRLLGLSAVAIGGPIVAGMILRTGLGEGIAKKLFGVKDVHSNRFTKALILFSQLKVAEGIKVLKKGPDKNEKFHKRVAEKLGLKDYHQLLWQIGNLDFQKFRAQNSKKTRIAEALGTFGSIACYIPGISGLINCPENFTKEGKLREVIDKKIKDLKISVPNGATLSDVLKLLDEKIELGGSHDADTQKRLNDDEKARTQATATKDEKKRQKVAAAGMIIEQSGVIQPKERGELLQSSQELINETTKIERALPTFWGNFKKNIASMGFDIPGFSPSQSNTKEHEDYQRARKLLMNKFGAMGLKKDTEVFKTIRNDAKAFQRLVTTLQPGQKIPALTLQRFKKLRKQLFGPKGHYSRVKSALRRANDNSVAQYRKNIKTGKITTGKVWTAACNGLGATFYFSIGKNSKGEWEGNFATIGQAVLGTFIIAPAMLSVPLAAWGAIRGDYSVETGGPKGQQYEYKQRISRGGWKPRFMRAKRLAAKPWFHTRWVFRGGVLLAKTIKSKIPSRTPKAPKVPLTPTYSLKATELRTTKTGKWYRFGNGNFHVTHAELAAAKGNPEKACRIKYMQSLQVTGVRTRTVGGVKIKQYRINGRWINGPSSIKSPANIADLRGSYLRELNKQGLDIKGQSIGATGMLKYFQYLKTIVRPAIAAKLIYDLETAKDKKLALTRTTVSLAAMLGGAKSTDLLIGKRLPMTPAGQVCRLVLNFVGGMAAAYGFTQPLTEIIAPFLPQFTGDKHFYSKLTRAVITVTEVRMAMKLSNKIATKLITRSLEVGGTRKIATAIASAYGKTIGKAVTKMAATSWLKSLGVRLGIKGAICAGLFADDATFIGVLDDIVAIPLAIWMASDIYGVIKITRKCVILNREMKSRSSKPIEKLKFPNIRSRKALEAQLRASKDYPEGTTMDQILDQSSTSEIMAAISKIADLEVMIFRKGIGGYERYRFVKGHVWALKIVGADGKEVVKITEEDLSQKITFPAPKAFRKWPIEVSKLDEKKAASNYRMAILYLKSECGWTRMDYKIESKDKVTVNRLDGKQALTLARAGKYWKVEGFPYSKNLDFFQAVALANFANKLRVVFKKNKYTAGSKKPFEIDGSSIDFDKSGSMIDLTVLKKGTWMTLYNKKLGLSNQQIVDFLNSGNWS